MPTFSQHSLKNLVTCHDDLQDILFEAIKLINFTVLCGHRGEEEQNKAFEDMRSQARFPLSKHNKTPSLAVDVAMYPVQWGDSASFIALGFFLKGIAAERGIKLRLGSDWDMNFSFTKKGFFDGPHIELYSKLINGKWVEYDV